jgi:UDP-N-acetylmuramate dehydrogenase
VTDPPFAVASDVALGPLTTLELGGPARWLLEAADEATAVSAVRWADEQGVPLLVLGGGSNVVVADAGFPGLVLRLATRGRRFAAATGDRVLVDAAAGEPWDDLVSDAVARGLAGLECLAGIPGLAGATPIQNVGAYGQEVADTVHEVRAVDRASGAEVTLAPEECEFSYRDSVFKRRPHRYLVLGVTFALTPGGPPTVRYRELAQALAARGGAAPDLAGTAATVRALRRTKSMLLDPDDPNRRSVGSFFMNPVLTAADAAAVIGRAVAAGIVGSPEEVPRFPAGPDRVKLAAGWLIEHAGLAKGLRRGAVGISSRHALALVHHGGGSTADLLALAREVRATVAARFGVALQPEPVLVGSGEL